MANDYEVGYGRPPKHTRFQRGQSGNPKGRPKSTNPDSANVAELLDAPVKVTAGGKPREMAPFEAAVRKLVKRALDKDLRAISKFIRLCEEYGIITPPTVNTGGGVIIVPKEVDFQDWVDAFQKGLQNDEN